MRAITLTCRLPARLLLAAAALLPVPGQQTPSDPQQERAYAEYEVKAAYLVNFLRFVDWTPRRDGKDEPFVIGIVGKSEFGDAFKAADGQPVRGTNRKLQLRWFAARPNDAELRACHVVFVCRSEHQQLQQLLEPLRGLPVLTVTEGEGRAGDGMVFSLVREARKVRLEFHAPSADSRQLKIDSRLRQLVEVRK